MNPALADASRRLEGPAMKHAGTAALDDLEPLLAEIRARPSLKEKSRGSFYRGGKAWLHFHEDPAGLFADLKFNGDWLRFDVSETAGRSALLRRLEAGL
jgi:hypothetical protein